MSVLAIDPGNAQSGYVVLNGDAVLLRGKCSNDQLVAAIYSGKFIDAEHLAIEHAQSFGAKVWNQVFDATLWAGRFIEAWQHSQNRGFTLMFRRDVKLHVTGSPRAKDGQVRQCLLERWGGKDKAVGKKSSPGALYGVTADCWAALAVAVTFADQRATSEPIASGEVS